MQAVLFQHDYDVKVSALSRPGNACYLIARAWWDQWRSEKPPRTQDASAYRAFVLIFIYHVLFFVAVAHVALIGGPLNSSRTIVFLTSTPERVGPIANASLQEKSLLS
jgi:hypothetical protein